MKNVQKGVGDLGVAAFMLMKGFRLCGRAGKVIYFDVPAKDMPEFNRLKREYLVSEFHRFDHYLMSLKKFDESEESLAGNKFVTDLGAAAYLLMYKFKVIGRQGKAFYFEISGPEEDRDFDEKNLEYATSEFHEFDSKLMSVKKLQEFMK